MLEGCGFRINNLSQRPVIAFDLTNPKCLTQWFANNLTWHHITTFTKSSRLSPLLCSVKRDSHNAAVIQPNMSFHSFINHTAIHHTSHMSHHTHTSHTVYISNTRHSAYCRITRITTLIKRIGILINFMGLVLRITKQLCKKIVQTRLLKKKSD